MNVILWLALWFAVSIAATFFCGSLLRLNHRQVVIERPRVTQADPAAAKMRPLAA
jgi:hypothetical protein